MMDGWIDGQSKPVVVRVLLSFSSYHYADHTHKVECMYAPYKDFHVLNFQFSSVFRWTYFYTEGLLFPGAGTSCVWPQHLVHEQQASRLLIKFISGPQTLIAPNRA